MSKLKLEPVAVSAALVAVLNALIVLGVFSLTDVQVAAINAAVVAVLGLVVRSRVTPVAKFDSMVDPAP